MKAIGRITFIIEADDPVPGEAAEKVRKYMEGIAPYETPGYGIHDWPIPAMFNVVVRTDVQYPNEQAAREATKDRELRQTWRTDVLGGKRENWEDADFTKKQEKEQKLESYEFEEVYCLEPLARYPMVSGLVARYYCVKHGVITDNLAVDRAVHPETGFRRSMLEKLQCPMLVKRAKHEHRFTFRHSPRTGLLEQQVVVCRDCGEKVPVHAAILPRWSAVRD